MKTIQHLVVLPILSAFLFVSVTVFAQETKETPKPVKILNLAHRGLSYIAPENTLLSFKLAIQIKANGAECDVYRTADGVLVLSHDKNTKRTAGVDLDITKTNFEELRKLDVGSWKGKHFAGEKIPTLEEYLLLLKGSGCMPVIEVKQEGIEKDIVDLLHKLNMFDDVFVISFSTKTLGELRPLGPTLKTLHIFSLKFEGTAEANAESLAKRIIETSQQVGTNYVSLNERMLSPKLVDILHEKGFEVWAWTINEIPLMNKLLDWGLDSITSDRPDLLTDVLKQRKK